MGGWHLRMTWGQEVLRDVNFVCRTHPAAQSDIIIQQWVTGSHCVWSVVEWLIVYYQDDDYFYPGQHSLSITDRMIPPLRRKHSHGKAQYTPGKQLLRSWYNTNLERLWTHCAKHINFDKLQTYGPHYTAFAACFKRFLSLWVLLVGIFHNC